MEKHGYNPAEEGEQRLPEGVALEAHQQKKYLQLELDEGVLALNYNEYKLPNGAYIEINERGEPVNDFVKKWISSPEFKGRLK